MTDQQLRDAVRTALHDEWWRGIREKIADSPDGHVDRLTDAIMRDLAAAGFEFRIACEALAVRRADRIEVAAQLVVDARNRLSGMLTAACPGPHHFVQHRDHRPPWCDACRYTPDGIPIRTAAMGA